VSLYISTFSMGTCATGSSNTQYADVTDNCCCGVSSMVRVNLLVTALGIGVAGAGVVAEVEVAAGVGVVVEAGRGGGVELEEVMFVGAHKAEGPS
jgi:hypothetical protein